MSHKRTRSFGKEKEKATEVAHESSQASQSQPSGATSSVPILNPEFDVKVDRYRKKVEEFAASGVAKLDERAKELLVMLCEINGEESYNASHVAVGGYANRSYLYLPQDLAEVQTSASDVGLPETRDKNSVADMSTVFHLNRSKAPKNVDADMFGLLRMEAWKAGWVGVRSEVKIATRPNLAEAVPAFVAALAKHSEKLPLIKMASWVIPLCAEFVFRSQGHHFLSGNAAEFSEKYISLLNSCLTPAVSSLLPPAALYHAAFHWIGPQRIHEVITAQRDSGTIPEAIITRLDSAPSGTAIICSTSRVLRAMGDLEKELSRATGCKVGKIHALDRAIRADPLRYHRTSFAYGVTKLTKEEEDAFDEIRDMCEFLAPACEAFIKAYYRQGDLGQVKVFSKHANSNPVLTKKCLLYYKSRSSEEQEDLVSIYRHSDSVDMPLDNSG